MANGGGWTPSKIKPGGWLIIAILLGVTAWYLLKQSDGHAIALPFSLPSNTSITNPFASQSSAPTTSSSGDIIVLTTGTKKQWLSYEIDRFNAQSQTGQVELDILESREGMQKILAGAEQPDIWSPSSTVWTDRLAEIGPSRGIHIHQDDEDYRILFQSPLVFLVVKSDLSQLSPILTSRHPFSTLARLNRYKFAYADPLNASSGMLTLSLLLNEYADIHNTADLDAVANSEGFADWLKKVDRGLATENTEGSSQLEADFESNPGERSFITTYESSALKAVDNNPNLAIVYPNPTASATQVAVRVDGPWSTDAKKATAKAFLDFITSDSANSDELAYYFRPAINGGEALYQRIENNPSANYFSQSYRAVSLPSYDAINDANVVWHQQEP